MSEKKIQTGLRLPEKQYNRIKAYQDRTGLSVNSIILNALEIGLNNLDQLQELPRSSAHNLQDTV